MRIAICGALGVEELSKQFLERWPMYETSKAIEQDYKIPTEPDKKWVKKTLKEIDDICDVVMSQKKDANILHVGSVLDPLAKFITYYTRFPEEDQNHLSRTLKIIKTVMGFYDIIIYIPSKTKYVDYDNLPEISKDIDTAFISFYAAWEAKNTTLFPFDEPVGSPTIIEVVGDENEKLETIGLYINKDGGIFTNADNMVDEFLKEQNIEIPPELYGSDGKLL